MGKRKKESLKLPPFVALLWELLNSKAYKALPPSAAKALPYFLGKDKTHPKDPAYYEVEFKFTYAELKRLGFAYSTGSTLIQDLVKFGFIDPVLKGGLRGAGRTASIFKRSERWRKYDTPWFVKIDFVSFIPKPRKKLFAAPVFDMFSFKK